MSDHMLSEVLQELSIFKRDLVGLTQRLAVLEDRIANLDVNKVSAEASNLARVPEPRPDRSESPLLEGSSDHTTVKPIDRAASASFESVLANLSSAPHAQKLKAQAEQTFELQIGSLWLNRIGLGALLIGVVSLLLYSFQYFGPNLKIICGFLISGLLIYFSRKPQSSGPGSWFNQGLNALGWSIAFFSGFATYFIPDLQIHHSLPLEFVLLGLIAGGAMSDALLFDSQSTAILSSSFAACSVCLCADAVNPYLSLLVIALALMTVTVHRQWHSALLFGVLIFFVPFAYCYATYQAAQTWIATSAISIAWLIVNVAIYLMPTAPAAKQRFVVSASLVNALGFTTLGGPLFVSLFTYFDKTNVDAAFYAVCGILYLLTAKLFKHSDDTRTWTLHLLVGLSMINASIWTQLTGKSWLVLDLIEIALLVAAGLRLEIKAFRWFAAGLAIISALNLFDQDFNIIMLGIISYAACAFLYDFSEFKKLRGEAECYWLGNTYFTFANVFVSKLIYGFVPTDWVGSVLLSQAMANWVFLLATRSTYRFILTALLLTVAFFTLIVSCNDHTNLPSVISIILMFAGSFHSRERARVSGDNFDIRWKQVYAIAASLLLTTLIFNQFPGPWISASLGLEGLALISTGFALKEKELRILGLSIFALMTMRLLFLDLASAATVTRIISFIFAGILLIGCSYAYGWFNKKLGEAKQSSEPTVIDGEN
jgi:uncharacterized membrane protein